MLLCERIVFFELGGLGLYSCLSRLLLLLINLHFKNNLF